MSAPQPTATASPPPTSLLRHADFLKLWTGQAISVFGSQFTQLALPIIAVLGLKASAAQMGILSAVQTAPFLLLGLFAGVWVDRLPRRPILIAGDLGRALLLMVIALAAFGKILGMPHLYVAGFLVGVLTVFFDVAYQAYLPALVGREHLIEGNSKLEASRSMAQLSGPGIAGVLIQALSAPWAIFVDALSFLCSALFLGRIRTQEERPRAERAPLLREVQEGIAVVLDNRILRSIAACTGTWNFFAAVWSALYILFATRELGLSPAAIGVIASLGNAAGLIASLTAGALASRVGIGPIIVWAAFLSGFSAIPIVLAAPSSAFMLLTLAGVIMRCGGQIYNINQVSLRQAIIAQRLQGRMNATMRFLVWGTMPLGGLAGGLLGEALGLRAAIGVGAAGSALAFLWIWLSPLRSLSRIPTPAS